jgi:membrane-associated phospholipid phosphatase
MAPSTYTENPARTSTQVNFSKSPKNSKLDNASETQSQPWLWKITFFLGPDLIATAFFTLALATLVAIYGAKIIFSQASTVYPLTAMLLLILSGFSLNIKKIFSRHRQAVLEFFRNSLAMLRDWLPMVWLAFVYENLHDLTNAIRPTVVDETLRTIDEAVFGVEPTLILQKFMTPLLSDYMTLCYGLYFLFPILCLGIIYYRKEFIKFREIFLSLNLCYYLGFLGYLLVPAIGPRYYMAQEFSVPITGVWLTDLAANAWDTLESLKRDCFPSLHTAISTIAFIYMWRYRKIWKHGKMLFAICAPLIVSLWISTIYLRYHWTVDVFAGWVLAVFCSWVAPWFIRWYYQKKTSTTPDVSIDLKHAIDY